MHWENKYSQSVCNFLVCLLPTGGRAEGLGVGQCRSDMMHDYLTWRPCWVLGRISARARSHPPPLPWDLRRGKLGDASSCFVCPATGGCQSPEMSAHVKQLSAALNLLMVLIYFKCFSPFRVSALCQGDGTSLLLSLKCGNLSAHLQDGLYVGCSKCSLISPADCLLSVVYLSL